MTRTAQGFRPPLLRLLLVKSFVIPYGRKVAVTGRHSGSFLSRRFTDFL